MQSKRARTRATALPENDVGAMRYTLYKLGHKRIQAAIEAGYYLEAISLVESLISDRLESRLSYVTASNVAFLNLGALIDLMRTHERSATTKKFVVDHIDAWRRDRNTASHEMLKIELGDNRDWSARQADMQEIAVRGYHVLKELARLLNRGRPRRAGR